MKSTITPPEGHEIISPDIAKLKPEGMMCKGTNSEGCQWVLFKRMMVEVQTMLNCNCIFSAPLGTTAALATPLPEARCCGECVDNSDARGSIAVIDHKLTCPCHPRNRLVRVLPGQMKDWKVEPKGLMWASAGKQDWTECGLNFPVKRFVEPVVLAYALPQWSYDEAMGRGEKCKNCNGSGVATAGEGFVDFCGVCEEGKRLERGLSTQPESEVKTCQTRTPSPACNAAPETSEPFRAAATPSAEEMLEWLRTQIVEVRTPLRFGSKSLFVCEPKDLEGDVEPSELIVAIASAMKEGKQPPCGNSYVADGCEQFPK